MSLLLFDVSSHNDALDWPHITADGAIIKSTEGVGYVNPLYAAQLAGARGRGAAGHYHFARPDLTAATDEADYCLAQIDWRRGEPVALDYETDAPSVDHNAWCLAFLARIEAKLGIVPMLYTYSDFARRNLGDPRLARYPLWWASYNPTMAPPPVPWTRVALWQYAGDASGQPGAGGPVDLNRFAGTLDDWRALGTPLVAAAPPAFGPYGVPLGGGFLQTYRAAPDALARWGYPVTGELTATVNGKELTVQYFERARFEYAHDTGLITFGRIGAELAHLKGLTTVE